jgi:hypothetical protein
MALGGPLCSVPRPFTPGSLPNQPVQTGIVIREHPDEGRTGRTAISLTAEWVDNAQENVGERTKDLNFGPAVLFVAAVDG